MFSLGPKKARFSVVSFASIATTRVPWSHDASVIDAGIDQMTTNGKTSISGGFEAAGLLFADARPGATKVVLLVTDGEQNREFAVDGKTPSQTAIDAAVLVKETGVTVFAWDFLNAEIETLRKIATDSSKAIKADD
eukprot:scaffold50828_cov62-Phaeocystis_antarctica.AAC.1